MLPAASARRRSLRTIMSFRSNSTNSVPFTRWSGLLYPFLTFLGTGSGSKQEHYKESQLGELILHLETREPDTLEFYLNLMQLLVYACFFFRLGHSYHEA